MSEHRFICDHCGTQYQGVPINDPRTLKENMIVVDHVRTCGMCRYPGQLYPTWDEHLAHTRGCKVPVE